MHRRTLSALLAPLLVVAACASSSGSGAEPEGCPRDKALDAVKVGGKAKSPELDFKQPLSVEVTSCKVLKVGDGKKLTNGATASFDYVFVNGRDGSEVSSSYGQEPAEVLFDEELMAGVHTGLLGVTEGTRILIAITPKDGFGAQGDDPQTGVKADDTLLLLVDLIEVRSPLKKATGAEVDEVPGLPTVVISDKGIPTITVPKETPPTELVSQPLIEGKGAIVKTGQSITVHYTGVLWDTGAEFDSSWASGKPVSFPIGTGGVIPGWDKGLVGKRIGSRVLLIIPPADGYPDGQGEAIPAGATLVFVVDILDAHG